MTRRKREDEPGAWYDVTSRLFATAEQATLTESAGAMAVMPQSSLGAGKPMQAAAPTSRPV